MNKSAVCERPGWTAGRVEKFPVVEHARTLRGSYGRYTEYEYSLPQILEVQKSPARRKEAAKYLKVPTEDLDGRIAEIYAKREADHAVAVARAAAVSEELKAKIRLCRARIPYLIFSEFQRRQSSRSRYDQVMEEEERL